MDKEGYDKALRFLVAQQMDVYVIHVLSPEELDPDVKGDLKLIDCEDDDVAEVTVSRPLLDKYKRTLAAFVDGAREFCTRRGMSYLMTSTETPVETLVANYLRKRGLVRVDAACDQVAIQSCEFLNTLTSGGSGACWRLVPPAIVALYFLKLRRAAAGSAEHVPLEPGDRGPARQFALAAAAAELAAVSATAA